MASRRCKTIEDLYTRILRVKRKIILTELPDTKELLKDSRMEKIFTKFEKGEITSQKTPSDNAEKMVRALEFKGYDSYKVFLSVLREYRPSLADKLTDAGEELLRMNSGEDGPDPKENSRPSPTSSSPRSTPDNRLYSEEDAGLVDFNQRGAGPSYHISSISIACRNYLGEQLNQRETFIPFCQALEVDHQLAQVSLRSGNPTGYLLQELSGDPDATMERLKTALSQIGKPHLFESVLQLNDT